MLKDLSNAQLGTVWLDKNGGKWRVVELMHHWTKGNRVSFERPGSSDWAMYNCASGKMASNVQDTPLREYTITYQEALNLVGTKIPEIWLFDPPYNVRVTRDRKMESNGLITFVLDDDDTILWV